MLIPTRQIKNVYVPAVGNLDPYDLRQNSSALFPPEYYVKYLHLSKVASAIGAETTYRECPNAPYDLFVKTGDVCRFVALNAQCAPELIALNRTHEHGFLSSPSWRTLD